ncbi:MAG: hypothetical protein F6K42_36260 [Leptolyngbya sp. SIO1D8]|nr:hypothetical protein [Leptolyngbya sp. SIO1D8]
MINYYPWKTHVLLGWLKYEISTGKDLQELERRLRIPRHILLRWLTNSLLYITLEQIQSIAHYRGWSFDAAVEWLAISPAHLSDLRNQQACV